MSLVAGRGAVGKPAAGGDRRRQTFVCCDSARGTHEFVAWLALTGQARLREPRRLRFRLFSAAAQLVTTGRRRLLGVARHRPWPAEITTAPERLRLLPNPG